MSETPFGHEVLEVLHDRTRVFLKLDFAYLAAIGTIVTALKFSRGELIGLGASMKSVVFALIALGIIDTLIHTAIFEDWLSARSGRGRRLSPKATSVMLGAQPTLHLLFIGCLMSYATGQVSGYTSAQARYEGRVLLQEAVEIFILEKGFPPKSLDELRVANKLFPVILSKLDGEDAIVEPTGPKTYRITFAGWDKTFGTADDDIVTQDLQLRKVLERMKSETETNRTDK